MVNSLLKALIFGWFFSIAASAPQEQIATHIDGHHSKLLRSFMLKREELDEEFQNNIKGLRLATKTMAYLLDPKTDVLELKPFVDDLFAYISGIVSSESYQKANAPTSFIYEWRDPFTGKTRQQQAIETIDSNVRRDFKNCKDSAKVADQVAECIAKNILVIFLVNDLLNSTFHLKEENETLGGNEL